VIDDDVAAIVAVDNASQHLGFTIDEARAGRARLRWVVSESDTNGHGIAHGGIVFALADTAFACAAASIAPGTATAEASISYVAPAHLGEELVADAAVSFIEGRRTVVDVIVRAGDRTIALYRGHGRILRAQP
jgi:acyl-CoA thioesterase